MIERYRLTGSSQQILGEARYSNFRRFQVSTQETVAVPESESPLHALATAVAVTSVYSFFYEGWGRPATTAAGFLLPAVCLVGLCAAAVAWPRTGGLLLLAAEGVQPSRRWWVRNYRPVVVVGLPFLAVVVGPARQLPDLLARLDDRSRGMRTITGNGVTLVWAPQGPGWNQQQPDGSYRSWTAITGYGGSGAGLCEHLSEDGTSLLPEPIHVWRLPTVDEVVRSLTRGGRNAGCAWDGRSPHATCAQPPDKETPLWAPDQPPIYYLTSNVAGERHALGVNYTGGVTPHLKTASAGPGIGYRCVKAAAAPPSR